MAKNLLVLCTFGAVMLAATLPSDAQQTAEDGFLASVDAKASDSLGLDGAANQFDSNAFSRFATPVADVSDTGKALTAGACFELHNGAGVTWYIDAKIDVNAYPFAILGGGISGTICDSPNWTLTGGSIGPALSINGSYTGSASCAATTSIVGNYGPPSAYSGTYGFFGATTPFRHRTLFLGYNRPTCP